MFATIKDLNTNKKYEKFIQAKTAWFENLVANNAFLNNLTANDAFIKQLVTGLLFTKNITLKNGGIIQSENYKSGTSGWKIDSNGDVEFFNGLFRGQIDGANGIFNGDLIGGKVYFSSLGLYGLYAGSEEIIEYEPTFSSDFINKNVSKKVRFIIDCAKSKFLFKITISGSSGGDTGFYNNISIGIYFKKNGSVSQTNYTDFKYQNLKKKVGEYTSLEISTNISVENPNEYIEVLFTYSTNGIPLRPACKASLGISEKNRYLKSCIDIIEI